MTETVVDRTTILDMAKNDKLFNDDTTIEDMEEFLARLKLTQPVKDKLLEVYTIASSHDNTLSWSNAWLLQRRSTMLKLQLLEYKNQLKGADADSLLSGDFDIAIEVMFKRVELRNMRSFEGFERKSTLNNATKVT